MNLACYAPSLFPKHHKVVHRSTHTQPTFQWNNTHPNAGQTQMLYCLGIIIVLLLPIIVPQSQIGYGGNWSEMTDWPAGLAFSFFCVNKLAVRRDNKGNLRTVKQQRRTSSSEMWSVSTQMFPPWSQCRSYIAQILKVCHSSNMYLSLHKCHI